MQEILQICQNELTHGTVKRRHPFRYFSLATVSEDSPRLRTVVLRKFLADFNLLFYTDTRSQKVAEFRDNPKVSALFYHPKKLLQVRVDGIISFVEDEKLLREYWNNIPENSRKDYITQLAPGTKRNQNKEVAYDADNPNFLALVIKAQQIEYLQLQRPSHQRVLFTKVDGEWQGQALVP